MNNLAFQLPAASEPFLQPPDRNRPRYGERRENAAWPEKQTAPASI